MRFTYDLHLHSCLSPCGDEDMTPYNLVNMAALLGLDIIALTDHNSTGNCRSALKAGEAAGVLVLPGMELCTAEEIHMVCLFDDIDKTEAFGAYIATTIMPVKNKPEIFGRQLYMDHEDRVLGEEDTLLITASSVSIDDVGALAASYGGFCYPAHIDRSSNSLLANFGVIPPELGFVCAELSYSANREALVVAHPILKTMRLIRASDAHYLENMREPETTQVVHLPERNPTALLEHLRRPVELD